MRVQEDSPSFRDKSAHKFAPNLPKKPRPLPGSSFASESVSNLNLNLNLNLV